MVRRVVRDDAFLRRAMRDHGAERAQRAAPVDRPAHPHRRAGGGRPAPVRADLRDRGRHGGVGAKRHLGREKRRRAPTLWIRRRAATLWAARLSVGSYALQRAGLGVLRHVNPGGLDQEVGGDGRQLRRQVDEHDLALVCAAGGEGRHTSTGSRRNHRTRQLRPRSVFTRQSDSKRACHAVAQQRSVV